MTQLALEIAPSCKRKCAEPVVGSSITGEGHVCKRHNEEEWGLALSRKREGFYRRLGAQLLVDSRRPV